MLIISTEIWLHEDCLSRFQAKIPHIYIRNLQYIVCKWMDKNNNGPVRYSNLGPWIFCQVFSTNWAIWCQWPNQSEHHIPSPVNDIFYISIVFPLAGVNLSVSGVGTAPNVTGYGRNNDGPDLIWIRVPWLSNQMLYHWIEQWSGDVMIELVSWQYVTFET